MKVASVINNYIKYMREHRPNMYQKVIYPAIFDKEYEKQQVDMFDEIENNEVEDNRAQIDAANKWARTKNQFKKGNQSGIQFAPKDLDNPIDGQIGLDL